MSNTTKSEPTLKLHPEHGLNPSLYTCFWCNQPIGVALLGATYRGPAPKTLGYMNYDPCDNCHEQMQTGTTLIEIEDAPQRKGQPPLVEGPDAYPTGNWWVITKEAAKEVFREEAPIIFISPDVAQGTGLYEMGVSNAPSVRPTAENDPK